MSVAELSKFIGKKGTYNVRGMNVTVLITDVRVRFGTVDLLITPDSGSGAIWVCESSGYVKVEV
jgi:hypothetical protein